MRRNSFSSQIIWYNILLPSSLSQADSLNADPRRHKVSIRRTSIKTFFQVLMSVLLRYCISSHSHSKWLPQTCLGIRISILLWKSGTEIWFSSIFRWDKQPPELPVLCTKLAHISSLGTDHFKMGMHVLLVACTSSA